MAFLRTDRAFNELCLACARNEFAAGAMVLTHALSRRFWYLHSQRSADMPLVSRLHADMARCIASGNEAASAKACDALLDVIVAFTQATVSTDV